MCIQNKLSRIVFSFVSALLLVACSSGSSIITGTTRQPTDPESVKLYLEEPKQYEVIGLVEAISDAGWTWQAVQDYAVAELKKQAAKIGANGVLLTSAGEKTTAIYGTSSGGMIYAIPATAKAVSGKAIFVIEE